MSNNDGVRLGPPIANPVAQHSARKPAELVGQVALALTSLAVICIVLVWVWRDEGPAPAGTSSIGPGEVATSSADQSFATITARQVAPAVDYVLSPTIADLLRRGGLSPETGRTAAPLTFCDLGGTFATLEQYRGKVVLIAFWGASCAPCLVELTELERLAEQFKESEFVVLPVCTDETDAGKAPDVAARVAPRLTVYVDSGGSARKDYFVMHLPQAFLVDREGRLVGRTFGDVRWAGKGVEELMSACLRSPIFSRSAANDAL